jgi:hypothetical protein
LVRLKNGVLFSCFDQATKERRERLCELSLLAGFLMT